MNFSVSTTAGVNDRYPDHQPRRASAKSASVSAMYPTLAREETSQRLADDAHEAAAAQEIAREKSDQRQPTIQARLNGSAGISESGNQISQPKRSRLKGLRAPSHDRAGCAKTGRRQWQRQQAPAPRCASHQSNRLAH